MTFQDMTLKGGLVGKSVSGLAVSNPAAMQIQVATGSITVDGTTYTLASAQSRTYTADSTDPIKCEVHLIDNGTITDIWFSEHVDDGLQTFSDIPTGYTKIHTLAWFEIAASETNLSNSTIYRRVLI